MNVIKKLKQNVEDAACVPFFYGSRGDINRILDRAPLPCAFAYLLESGTTDDTNGICRERLTFALFFIDKTDFDFEAIENEDIIDECKKRAFYWYTKNRIFSDFQNVRINNTSRLYDEIADATVTGYALNVTMDEAEGVGTCNVRN